MQSGGGSGRNPAAPSPPGRSSPSPSSSSSAVSAPAYEQQYQQQQHLAFRQQQQQQQQLRKVEGDDAFQAFQAGGIRGGSIGASNFIPSSSSGVMLPQIPRKFGDAPFQHGAENPVPSPLHQAYVQYALQNHAAQQRSHGNLAMQQQSRIPAGGPHSRESDMIASSLKMQELMSLQAANQSQVSASRRSVDHSGHVERQQMVQDGSSADQRGEQKPPHGSVGQQLTSNNISRPAQSFHLSANAQNVSNTQLQMQQLKALHTWAQEHNIDLSHPSSANLLAQAMPVWHSARLLSSQKGTENSTAVQPSNQAPPKQQVMPSPVGSDNSTHVNSSGDHSVQVGTKKGQQTVSSISNANVLTNTVANSSNFHLQQQLVVNSRGNPSERIARPPIAAGNGGQLMHLPQSSGCLNQSLELARSKNMSSASEQIQAHQFRPLPSTNRSLSQHLLSSSEPGCPQVLPQGGYSQLAQHQIGFNKHQLLVLKAQILAFRSIKRGDRTLPPDVLEAIVPPSLDSEPQQSSSSLMVNPEKVVAKNVEEHGRHTGTIEKDPQATSLSRDHPMEEPFVGEENTTVAHELPGAANSTKGNEHVCEDDVKVEPSSNFSVKSDTEAERGSQLVPPSSNQNADKGKAVASQSSPGDAVGQVKSIPPSFNPLKDVPPRKYNGPLFDFPFFIRNSETSGPTIANNSSNFPLGYEVRDVLLEESALVLKRRRTENLRKVSGLLAVNLEIKRIRPDLVLRLQIEEKKLRLLDFQSRLRDEVDQEQQEIMNMSDRPYRKFVRQCERQRQELIRQAQQLQKATREKQLKSVFQWRKKLLEAHWAIRDARTTRNRGVAKYHERMLREYSKRKDDDRNKRMEALKNNDVDRYREMLLEQQTNIPGDAAQRYTVLSSFLSQTEEYLHKLGGKITASKNQQEVHDATNAAASAARAQGLSEEEVRSAAACAGQEVMIRNRFSEMNAPKENASVNKYYNLAHAVSERVVRQPSMLRFGTLRDYQLVGLQWMLSLYNNKLNGILADEMGLGKTVQVMALIAYLMEFKGNYGPHLIIVPNAVLVNWKSELHNWLPAMSCIFYVGGKDQRAKLFSHEVCALKFNVLVTTYEFIMYDRSKLSKVDWKYIIIDEAQRMKDRESVLARDLDRYRCQRRLLLTGTPLQNDLKELWSLLNLLLPEVFDSRKAFNDWFSKPFQKDSSSHNPEDDWLETEKKVIVIHRLHQILEPFMLRRRLEDVEGSLPPKVPIVLRCKMSAIQSAIYDWIKSTGTIRVDPEDEMRRVEKNPLYQVKTYKNLNNKCMELRKVCNHPLLSYPYFNDYSKDFIVKSCGKLWLLDRILIKLQRTGHRVLLFSTMTKLLDILEEYLQWRRLVYRRIDGTTSLEDRESAIVDFNGPDSDCFIFLLSIRAAGRGLNLQTADTVVIYDPDPNPQNEEQAVARAHRIGQRREVKVIYMEAVVDKIPSHHKEDDTRNGVRGDLDDDLAGKDRYMGSIESLIRNNIQQYKIDMADEVINAGRFDQRTTHEERRMTLETLLHDEERYQENVHDVPSMLEVNRMIARSEEEIEIFDQMDDELDWMEEMTKYNQVPKWLRAGSKDVNVTVANLSKKNSKDILGSSMELISDDVFSGVSPHKHERRRGRARGPYVSGYSIYRELEDEDFDTSSEERNGFSLPEEDGEIEEFEDEEINSADDDLPDNKEQSEDEGLVGAIADFEVSGAAECNRTVRMSQEAGSSGSSSGSRRLVQASTLIPSQKFGSLSALDARPALLSKKAPDDLEEGEIAGSGDSHIDIQQSSSWIHERDDNEEEVVVQPKIKRKRSIRIRPRYNIERPEEKGGSIARTFSYDGTQLSIHSGQDNHMQLKAETEHDSYNDTISERYDSNGTSLKSKRNMPSRSGLHGISGKPGRLGCFSGSGEDAPDLSRSSWNCKTASDNNQSLSVSKMSDSMQRKCKNVISKLQRRIDKEGQQIAPTICDWWKSNMNTTITNSSLDLQRVDHRVDNFEYSGVTEFITDVQLMLKNIVRHCNNSFEARNEARKLHDHFFNIMKIAFPDSDFREAKNAISFSGPSGTVASPSPRQSLLGQTRNQKSTKEVEPNICNSKGTLHSTDSPVDAGGKGGAYAAKLQRESRPASSSGPGLPVLAHPGDLVICKKKRKDRDKPASVQKIGSGSPSNLGTRAGPLSPPNLCSGIGRSARASHKEPFQQGIHSVGWNHQPAPQQLQQCNSGGGSAGVSGVQWARTVRKQRTDKRRPSCS